MPFPAPRDLTQELASFSNYPAQFAASTYGTASQFNPQFTALNAGNFNLAAGSIAPGMSANFAAANPELIGYNQNLMDIYNRVSANRPTGVSATGYEAATAGPAAQAALGGPEFQAIRGPQQAQSVFASRVSAPMGYDRVQAQQGDVGLATATNRLGSVGPSDIQGTLENQARARLATNGALTPQETRNAVQAAREAGAARGLINSNSTIAAEVLNRDALTRQRANENAAFASGVDQQGFAQRQAGLQNALNVSNAYQGYGQLGLQGQVANQGARTTANAQGLQAALANQATGLQANLANQQRDLTMNQQRLATGAQNQTTGLGYANLFNNNAQFNAQAQNQMGQFNAGQTNAAQAGNVAAVNAMNQFNQGLNYQGNQNDWTNAMNLGNYRLAQAQNPYAFTPALIGQTPDYTGATLGYGQDLYNTNFNALAAQEIARNNASAGKTSAGIGALGTIGGALLGGPVGAGLGGFLGGLFGK